MNYLLVVLTHGESSTLTPALASFAENVSPRPARAVIWRDGQGDLFPAVPPLGCDLSLHGTWEQRGFCAATRSAWELAIEGRHEYVFWLEHDFVFLRPVNLEEVAAVLDSIPTLAQVALMRNAVNEEERAAGGLYELRRDQYREQYFRGSTPWLAHEAYFTTNPSLMRRDFMETHAWPSWERPECEGSFGFWLRQQGISFGAWGNGEPWVEHVGVRDGFGY